VTEGQAKGCIVAKGWEEGHVAAGVPEGGHVALDNQLKLGIGVIRHRNCLIVLYSLTKYSAIFAEVKGYFGITAPDNQHGQKNSYSLRI
jgi:polyferredoxin